MTKVSATVRELPCGWLWKERGVIFKTAQSAIRAFSKEDRKAIFNGSAGVIRTTSWETTSVAGRKVIEFLTSK